MRATQDVLDRLAVVGRPRGTPMSIGMAPSNIVLQQRARAAVAVGTAAAAAAAGPTQPQAQ